MPCEIGGPTLADELGVELVGVLDPDAARPEPTDEPKLAGPVEPLPPATITVPAVELVVTFPVAGPLVDVLVADGSTVETPEAPLDAEAPVG